MADDFDKEAPDVTENQIITENPFEFSVTVMKTEVQNFYDSEFECTTSSVQDRKLYLQEEIIPNTFEALSSEIPDNEIYQDKLFNSDKIILGSKPNLVSEDEDHFEYSDKLYPENDVSFAKVSNFHPDSIDENYFEELVTSYEPKVELLDIQPYLHKSKRYCATCGILFPELNAFEKHVRIYHKASDLNKRRIYKCTICDKKFVALQFLKNHISNIHKLNNGKILQRSRYRRVLDKTMRQHRCTICAKNFVAPHVLRRHLINIHKINYAGVLYQKKQNTKSNTTKELDCQIVNHDTTSEWRNKCFHCKRTFDTQKCLIEHLYDILQMKRKNTETVPVIKSILFKCNKCDINFTSSQFAANHAEHMEMLINWKCTICNRIFKREDALSHERQHSVSNNFLVYNLKDLDVTRILYKCSKCAVHFTESNFLYHFRDCGLEVSKSIHCKICNIKLDYNIKTSHESESHMDPNYYIIIESDVISDNPVKLTANKYQAKYKLQELRKPFREVKVVLQRIDSNKVKKCNSVKLSSDESLSNLESSSYERTSNTPQKLQKDNNAQCSMTETIVRNQKKIDLRRKPNLTYYYCETCKCTKYKSRLKRKVNLEARCKNFSKDTCKRCGLTFTTTQPINPAMPEVVNTKRPVKTQLGRRNLTYYYCETCKCFLTKFNKANTFHKRKLCKKIVKATCKHCGLMFTSASIMTHIRLHEERKDLTVKNFKLFNLYNGQPMDPPVLSPELISLQQPVNNKAEIGHIQRPANNGDRSTKKDVKYYFCETCKCSVTNFKKNVHLEARCKDLAKSTCKYCGLTFTKVSMITHMRLHKERKGLTLESFKFFNLYNGLRTSPPIREVVNLNRHVNIAGEYICSKPPINNEADFENVRRGNQAQSGNVKPPINIITNVESIISPVNNEAKVLNTKCLSKIQTAVENIIGLVYNKAEVESVKQTINIGSEVLNTKLPSNIQTEVENIKRLVHNEAEVENLKRSINIGTAVENLIRPINNNTELEYFENPINSEAEDTNIKLPVNSKPVSNNIALDESINRHVDNEDENINKKRNVNVKAEVASIIPAGKEAEIINIKLPLNIKAKRLRRNLNYYFCETCKCFVTKFTKDAHLQARCKSLSKITCKRCGLRFTKASMMTHERLHEENKDLSVENFKFFYLNNGQSMNAPISEVVNRNRLVDERNLSNYYCESCKCFETEIRKGGHIQENCINIAKLPCKYCGLIFSSASLVLHKSLHEETKNLTLKNFTFFDLHNGKPMNPPLPEYPKCISCAVHFLTITAKNSHICSEVSSLTCHICEIKLSEAAFKLHMTFHQFITDNTKMIESNNVQSAISAITINLDQNIDHHGTEKNVTNTSNLESHGTELHNSVGVAKSPLRSFPDSIVYTCRNCSVSVETYDKAVEHSQRHYEPEEHVTQTIVCDFCNLNIDEACYTEHQNEHENGSQFKSLHFDSYYLPADNNLWIKHIFETLPNEKIVDILRNSIYRFECRIKMDVIQQGDPNFTVYKCDQCGCFIEPSSLFKHSDNACFKLRNHPCTVCGIPFNSSTSRIDHEKIHNRPDLTMESYRIVVFNRERDLQINRSFCLRKKYVLYKCRNCDVIIDKLRKDVHKCDFTNVKKCPDCALLLNMKDYESHMTTHKEFISFNYSNMKVILLGEANSLEATSEINSKLKFKGAIYDYKMLVCNKCEICIRDKEFMPKHICRFGKQRSKCLKCGLYFSVGRLKTHTRCHEQDPDFLRSNMYIISFDPCTLDKNKNDTKFYSKDKDS